MIPHPGDAVEVAIDEFKSFLPESGFALRRKLAVSGEFWGPCGYPAAQAHKVEGGIIVGAGISEVFFPHGRWCSVVTIKKSLLCAKSEAGIVDGWPAIPKRGEKVLDVH